MTDTEENSWIPSFRILSEFAAKLVQIIANANWGQILGGALAGVLNCIDFYTDYLSNNKFLQWLELYPGRGLMELFTALAGTFVSFNSLAVGVARLFGFLGNGARATMWAGQYAAKCVGGLPTWFRTVRGFAMGATRLLNQGWWGRLMFFGPGLALAATQQVFKWHRQGTIEWNCEGDCGPNVPCRICNP